MRTRLSTLALLLLPALAPADEPPVFGGSLEVTSSRLSAAAAPERATLVLDRAAIERLPVDDLPALLSYLAGGGLARRSAAGLQADAQLRGASFEQVVVLVDGLRVNDPQTGHFNLNLPLPLAAVERIEVLLGPGSAVHGPDAFGGVIAVTTAAPAALRARLVAGEHGRAGAALATPLGGGAWAALERETAHGFRADTDYAFTRGAAGWDGQAGGFRLHASGSAEHRRFGAWAFYSDRFPNQWEENDVALLGLTATRPVASARLTLRAGAREHRDAYVLDRARPEWYTNRHRTRTASVQAALTGAAGALGWSAGAEVERAALDSSRLGAHDRDRAAAFAEASWRAGRLGLGAQLRADRLSSLGTELSPGFGLELDLGRGAVASLHRGRSFRQPSFTDLYYVSPANVGNPDLEPESAWTDEAMVRARAGAALVELSAFHRSGRDLIDFVLGDDDVWRAANHARVRTRGASLSALAPVAAGPLSGLRASVSWLQSDVDADPARSRYTLAHPRLEAALTGRVALPGRLTADVGVRLREPARAGSYALLDARVRRPLAAGVVLELDAANLLDRRYEELAGVPMPGRWLSVGLAWSPQ